MKTDLDKTINDPGRRRIGGLLIEKFAPKHVGPDERFEYLIRLSNVSDAPIECVVLTESVISQMRIEDSLPRSQVEEFNMGRWVLGPIEMNESKTIRVICFATQRIWFRSHTSLTYSLGGEQE